MNREKNKKLISGIIAGIIVLVVVGIVGALNDWFGAPKEI